MTWESRVVHINIESGNPPEPPTPTSDSSRLGGALSAEFLRREFPQKYQVGARPPRHPAAQLEFYLNALGKKNWELLEIAQVGPLLMFFFKRPLLAAIGEETAVDRESQPPSKDTAEP
jgi:hypothetical protein